MAQSSREIRIVAYLTKPLADRLDEFSERNGDLGRSSATRLLLSRQLKYEEWRRGRAEKNLPPYPVQRLPRFPHARPERAASMVESYRNRNPGISDEDAARLVVGSMTVFDGLRKHARKLVARVTREHENERLEREMNADLERRAKVREDPPEARE